MTEPTKSLPCPFCGSERIGVHKYKQRRASGFRALCLRCGMSQLGMCHGDHEQAIAAWNTRTPQPTQAGAVPLTDEQLAAMMRETWGCASIAPRHAIGFARAIEAAHGIGIKGGQHGVE